MSPDLTETTEQAALVLGSDVGGTFTDLVLVSEGTVTTAKVPTSAVQSDAIADGAGAMAGGRVIDVFIHGTTVATNTLLEGSGAATALITDAGFEDIIEIGRQDRPSLYDSYTDRPLPLAPRSMRVGIGHADGFGLPALPDGTQAVAVALVDGHRQPDTEQAIREAVRLLGFTGPVSLSSIVSPEFREYERTSTTVLNAYLTPACARYLRDLGHVLTARGIAEHIAVMRSSGGLMSPADAAELPAAILLSGPAGGATATAAFASAHGHERAVSFDMGGTSTDVCRIDNGVFDISYERVVGGHICRLPSARIHTVGAGGGSIAWIDEGGSLRVGPHSAGANPGPACYGKGGTAATVTDANVVLGRIGPEAALGGSLVIDRDKASDAIEPLAVTLEMSIEQTALGIVAVAEDVMGRAIRTVSLEEGSDPRGAHLYAFGGAGGLHATSLARSLGMAGVVFPPHSGVFSALGLLLSPPRADLAQSVFASVDDVAVLEPTLDRLAATATTQLEDSGQPVRRVEFVIDVRYVGQAHEIGVPFRLGDDPSVVKRRFTDSHIRRNGFARDGDPLEVVTVRCTATGDPAIRVEDFRKVGEHAQTGGGRSRRVILPSGAADAGVFERADLGEGAGIEGPAVIEENEATIFLGLAEEALVWADGSIEVTW